jgi:TonB family protein
MRLKSAFALIAAVLSTPVAAADIDDGQTAYNAGDFATALRLWQPLATAGNARAQNSLGVMFENGKGVPPDIATAVKWYRLAAAQGYGGAQYNLGLVYAIGRGGAPHDPLRAYMWFSLAAGSLSGDVGMLVAQTRDVFATAMTPEQIMAANMMADACRQSNYQNCEPAGDLSPGVATQPSNTRPAIAITSHAVTAADYPRESLRFHESGDVTVTYQIGESGTVTACAVILTSGNPRLDQAACEMVKKHWRYQPATEDGHPVSIQYISKISFPKR